MRTDREYIRYNIINIVILGLTSVLFIGSFSLYQRAVFSMGWRELTLTLLTVAVVHILKAIRLYLVLFWEGVSKEVFLKTYCKVTPVSILIPMKMGELFRMYCYGWQMGDFIKGILVVLLDRFADTSALITLLVIVQVFYGGEISGISIFLMAFIIAVLFCYFSFPGLCRLWKGFLLKTKATSGSLSALEFLDQVKRIYSSLSEVTKGRESILYILSLFAWLVEIGNVWLCSGVGKERMGSEFIQYLMAAFGLGESLDMQRFTVLSIIVLMITYLGIKGLTGSFSVASKKA